MAAYATVSAAHRARAMKKLVSLGNRWAIEVPLAEKGLVGQGVKKYSSYLDMVGVTGSIPVAPTILYKNAKIATPRNHASQIAGAKNRPNGSRVVASTGFRPAKCTTP